MAHVGKFLCANRLFASRWKYDWFKNMIASTFKIHNSCAKFTPQKLNPRNEPNSLKERKNISDLLENAALGTGPLDEVDEDDEWRTSPYPEGAFFATKSQAKHSLRPKVDPRETSIVLFPGQGAEYVGMGKELLKFPLAHDIFLAANQILGYDLLKLMLNGPEEELRKTIHAQPAVFVCSLAAVEKLKEERPTALENCMATAGFSLGEISALTFAGVFSFDAALRLVRIRAEAMQYASEIVPSGMAKVTYGPDSQIGLACNRAKEWCLDRGIENPECRVATYLSPNLKIIAGHSEALKFIETNKELYRIESVTRLPLPGAFHSSLMLPAIEMLKKKLLRINIREPVISVHSNVDGKRYEDTSKVVTNLLKQIYNPIKWEQTLHILYEYKEGSYFPETIECGPGNDLEDYLYKVNRNAAKYCVHFDV